MILRLRGQLIALLFFLSMCGTLGDSTTDLASVVKAFALASYESLTVSRLQSRSRYSTAPDYSLQADTGNGLLDNCLPATESGSFVVNCQDLSATTSCDGGTYQITAGQYTAGGSLDPNTDILSFEEFDLEAELNGGLLGGTLDCRFSFEMNTDGTNFVPDCDNFNCQYDGAEISCEAFEAAFSEGTCG